MQAKCGTLLKLVTISGTIVLDDFDIYYDDQVFTLFQEAGFVSYDSPTTGSGRRLKSVDSKVRNLRSLTEDFTLTGFFNLVDDYEWECASVDKPELPAVFSAHLTRFLVCERDGKNLCNFKVYSGDVYEQYGVVTEDGIEYMRSEQEIYENGYQTEIVDYSPYHPGVAFVTQYLPDGSRRRFQKSSDGVVSRCDEEHNVPKLKMNIPDDFLFYPLGVIEESNMRRFRLSYMIDTEEHPLAPENTWMHIDYFDDMTTHLPKVLIDNDGSIIQMDDIRTYDDAHIGNNTFSVLPDEFYNCVEVTRLVADGKFERFRDNITAGIDWLDNSTFTPEQLDLFEAWNWSLPYPAQVGGAVTFTQDDLLYYLKYYHHVDSAWTEWATDIALDIYHVGGSGSRRRLDFHHIGKYLSPPSPRPRGSRAMQRALQIFNANDAALEVYTDGQRRQLYDIAIGEFLAIDFSLPKLSISIGIEEFSIGGGFEFADGYYTIDIHGEGCAYYLVCVGGSISVNFGMESIPSSKSAITVSINMLGAFQGESKILKALENFAVIPLLEIYHKYEPYKIEQLGSLKVTYWNINTVGAQVTMNFAQIPFLQIYLAPILPLVAMFRAVVTSEVQLMRKVHVEVPDFNVDMEINHPGIYTMTIAIEVLRIWRLFWADWDPKVTKEIITKSWSKEQRCYDLETYTVMNANEILYSGETLSLTYSYLRMQEDGNLVLYTERKDRVIWASNTAGNPGAYLHLQADGNLVIKDVSGAVALWASNTVCPSPTACTTWMMFKTSGYLIVYSSGKYWKSNEPLSCADLMK